VFVTDKQTKKDISLDKNVLQRVCEAQDNNDVAFSPTSCLANSPSLFVFSDREKLLRGMAALIITYRATYVATSVF
jgi:hypothetical protein